jgi:hypothetical protein
VGQEIYWMDAGQRASLFPAAEGRPDRFDDDGFAHV